MVKVKLHSSTRINRQAAYSPEVQNEIKRIVRQGEGTARSRMARHRVRGKHVIKVTWRGPGAIIALKGKAAMSVEEGHHSNKDGSWIEGIHIMRRLVGGEPQ